MAGENLQNLPFVSFIIASYNAQKHLEKCLSAIRKQQYPQERIEILLVDAGSTDNTLEIAKPFEVKVINNPYHVAEFAKSIGIQQAGGKYIVILDADNEIVQKDWLAKNILPLENDSSLVGMDSVFLVKKDDFLVNRYCALLGLEDPLVRYMADLASNADIERLDGYSVYKIRKGRYPIFGSNGFIWRKKIFSEIKSYLPRYDEAEFCIKVVEQGYDKIGFVSEVGVYHHHLENIWQFMGKRFRRGQEFISRKLVVKDAKKNETFVWLDKYSKWEFLQSVFLCVSFFYPAYESIRGYLKSRDVAWFLHPFLAFSTVMVYGLLFIKFMIWRIGNYVVKLML